MCASGRRESGAGHVPLTVHPEIRVAPASLRRHSYGASATRRCDFRGFGCTLTALLALDAIVALAPGTARADVPPIVEVEEVVTRYASANNGAGPLWCYGSTVIARDGEEVFLSSIETGNDVPPLCNCRWQLWQRGPGGWKIVQHENDYRQREPCPIAVIPGGPVFLSANPSTQPAGVHYGPCRPLVLQFGRKDLAAPPKQEEPAFAEGTYFTDHSYRGFAADGQTGELLLVNINAKTSAQFVSHRDRQGVWHARGTIVFPIRSCYPQVALRNGAAHVLAIGDITEPNEQWRKTKSEKTGSKWDYVFRRLFYTYTPDIEKKPFAAPLEVETVDNTGGHIANLDLFIDARGAAHLLYLKQPYANQVIREKYFPQAANTAHLEYAVVREGKVVDRRTLAATSDKAGDLTPAYARFHVGTGEKLYVIAAGNMAGEKGTPAFGDFLAPVPPGGGKPAFTRIALKHPLSNFFTNTPRGGSKPGDLIDLHGVAADPLELRYVRIRLR